MNINQLRNELEQLKIPKNAYGLKGGLQNEVFCIGMENNLWEVDGTWSGAKERAFQSTDSVYDFADYMTFGVAGTFKGVIAPEEPFPPEHWLNSLEAAGLIVSGMQLLNQPTTLSMLDVIDNSVGKQVMNKTDDTNVDELTEGMS